MRFLFDEMLPPATTEHLRDRGHDAVSVYGIGLGGAGDDEVFSFAASERRIIVTENFADFTRLVEQRMGPENPGVRVLFVHSAAFPRGGAFPSRLAARLHEWAAANPDPYLGPHWL